MGATYSARGDVRGDCGHAHKTAESAQACADLDARQCHALGGGAYSDRVVYRDGEYLGEWTACAGAYGAWHADDCGGDCNAEEGE